MKGSRASRMLRQRIRLKHLLRDKQRGAFWSTQQDWTPDPEQAQDFANPAELVERWRSGGDVGDAEVVEYLEWPLAAEGLLEKD